MTDETKKPVAAEEETSALLSPLPAAPDDAVAAEPQASDASEAVPEEAPTEGVDAKTEDEAPAPAGPVAVPPREEARGLSRSVAWFANPLVWLLVAAVAVLGWQTWELRQRLQSTQQEMSKRLGEADQLVAQTRQAASESQAAAEALAKQVSGVEGRVGEWQGQYEALQRVYADLAKNRDGWALTEIDQLLSTASQQLQLAGDVRLALAALETADARLAQADQPQFLALRKALVRDIERLRALPHVDVAGMSHRIETVVERVDALPLAHAARVPLPPAKPEKKGPVVRDASDKPAKPVPPAEVAAASEAAQPLPAESDWLARSQATVNRWVDWRAIGDGAKAMAADVWGELGQLVRVQRLDQPAPALLAPEQAFFLRQNLKLRLLNARMALLARDGATYRGELRQARDWVGLYFDAADAAVVQAQATLKTLGEAELAVTVPAIDGSLKALREAQRGFDGRGG